MANPILLQFVFCFYLRISLRTGLRIAQALEFVEAGPKYL